MSRYRPPGPRIDILDNPRITNIAEGERFVAVVGLGRDTRTVFDEAIFRAEDGSALESDFLSAYTGDSINAQPVQVSSVPGIDPGDVALAKLISEGGVLYNMDALTMSPEGELTWDYDAVGVESEDIPSVGAVYYVTYTFDTPEEQYKPIVYTDSGVIERTYGFEDTDLGILTIAGKIVLENGVSGVILNQVKTADEGVFVVQEYKNAIDKLRKKDNIEYVVVVFPEGVERIEQEEVIAYAMGHVAQANTQDRERGILSGSPSANYGTGGFDDIQDYVSRATVLRNRDKTYIAPSVVWRRIGADLTLLDGNFAAVGVAAARLAQPRFALPIHGRPIQGIRVEEEKWNQSELNQLGAGNVAVLVGRNGTVTIRDDITTDPTSADTQEPSVRQQDRLLRRTLRRGLHNTFTSRGVVIDEGTVNDVIATTRAILQSLVNAGELYSFGEQDNPATGELQITAQQDPQEPRLITVTCSVKYLYPLKWIDVTVSLFV